jgi:mannosyl-oligosaccharide glucosidase
MSTVEVISTHKTLGNQEIVDQGLAITTHFLKSQTPASGYGGDWAVRVKVTEKKVPEERY